MRRLKKIEISKDYLFWFYPGTYLLILVIALTLNKGKGVASVNNIMDRIYAEGTMVDAVLLGRMPNPVSKETDYILTETNTFHFWRNPGLPAFSGRPEFESSETLTEPQGYLFSTESDSMYETD